MLLLAIDTSTTAITVALHDGTRTLGEATTLDSRGHAEHLAPGIVRVLAQSGHSPADLTDVACGLGPGPFTGLRVGIVAARALALATDAALHGVCSLDALAHEAFVAGAVGGGELLVATDARRKEVYWARYAAPASLKGAAGTPTRLAGPAVAKPGDLPDDLVGLPTVGRGPSLYPEHLTAAKSRGRPAGIPLDVSAAWLADLVVRRMAAGDPLDEHEPFYLRRPDAAPLATSGLASG